MLDRDPEYAEAERAHRAALAEQQELHLVQLDGVLGALREVARRGGSGPRVRDEARADAEAVVRLVDDRHLARVAQERAAFADRWRPAEREAVARHRAAVAAVLAGARGAGRRGRARRGAGPRAAAVRASAGRPTVVAWSAGAMALTDRVLLFHDRTANGPSHAEFADVGLGWIPGAVLLPHARRGCASTTPLGWPSWPCGRRPPAA